MEKINIIVNLENGDMPYEYRGYAYVNKDIIEFTDKEYNYKEYHYIFDKAVNRLIKSSDTNQNLILDFNNKEIKILEIDKELSMKMDVKKIDINGNNIKIIYKIDKNDIIFQIKEVK